MPCSPLKINLNIGETSRSLVVNRSKQEPCLAYSSNLKMERRYVPPKSLLTFNGLHITIPQKIYIFTVTAVGTANPIVLFDTLILLLFFFFLFSVWIFQEEAARRTI
jgi:hypothetical protein